MIVTPSQDEIQTVFRSYLLSILPSGVAVREGQVNRVSEPNLDNFVIFQVRSRPRLSTNVHEYIDDLFVASLSETTMTVTEILRGTVVTGRHLYGVGVAQDTLIVSQIDGVPGGVGRYEISVDQTVTSRRMAAGIEIILQPTQVNIQLSVHGDACHDNVQIISTMLHDNRAFLYFEQSGIDARMLYTTDPMQLPFKNGEQQYEDRYLLEAVLQANQRVMPGQQFADELIPELINVEMAYPATS